MFCTFFFYGIQKYKQKEASGSESKSTLKFKDSEDL
jgi:hypothetical protein